MLIAKQICIIIMVMMLLLIDLSIFLFNALEYLIFLNIDEIVISTSKFIFPMQWAYICTMLWPSYCSIPHSCVWCGEKKYIIRTISNDLVFLFFLINTDINLSLWFWQIIVFGNWIWWIEPIFLLLLCSILIQPVKLPYSQQRQPPL